MGVQVILLMSGAKQSLQDFAVLLQKLLIDHLALYNFAGPDRQEEEEGHYTIATT